MAEDYNVRAILTAYDQGFSAAMQQATKQTNALGSGIGGTIKQSALFTVGMKAASAGIDALSSHMGAAISRADTLKQFPKIMNQLGFSTKEATNSIDRLSKGIDGLPTSLDEIAKNTQSIALLTGDLDSATDTAIALNNAFLSSGSSSADAARGLTQYTQMLSAGKVDMQSWKTLLETMGPALNKVAEGFGYTGKTAKNDLYEALKSGKITFDELNQKIIELNEGTGGFAELAQTASKGIATSWQNIGTAVTKGLADSIKAVDEALDAYGGIAGVMDKVKTKVNDVFTSVNDTLKKVDFKGIVKAATPYWNLFKKVMLAAGLVIKKVATFFAENAAVITKLIPVVLGAVGAFKLMKAATNFASSVQTITKSFSKLANGVLARLAPQLVTTSAAETAAGTSAKVAAGSMVKLGAAVLMIGGGIALAATGIALLAQSAISLATSGGAAVAVMFGLMGALTAMMVVVSLLGPALIVGAAGMALFGAAVVLMGAGILVASAGVKIMASVMPTLAATTSKAGSGLMVLAGALVIMAPVSLTATAGMVAFGAAALGASVGIAASAIGAKTLSTSIKTIAAQAKAGGASLKTLSTSVNTVKTGMSSLSSIVSSTLNNALNKLKNQKSQWQSAGRNMSTGLANGIRNGQSGVINAAIKVAEAAIRAAKNKLKQHSPSRVFKEIGLYTAKGMAIGLESGERMVANATERMISVPNTSGLSLASGYNYGVVEVPLYIDGKEFARATASDVQSELNTRTSRANRQKGIL